MPPEWSGLRPRTWDPWARAAAGVWLVVLLVVCVRGALQPRSHSLYPTYATAGGDWLAGSTLYRSHFEPPLDQYRYSPLVAVVLVPFHLLPDAAGGALWRLLNGAVFLGGLAWWLRSALPVLPTSRQQAAVFLLVVPLALSSLNNAQPNPLVIGLLLAAAAAAATDRWWTAASCVALATAIKVYPLAVGLLLAAVYPRRFLPRLVLVLTVLAALPFLCQRFGYVAGQYAAWYERLREADESRKYWPLHMAYRDLWLLFRVAHVPISSRGYLLVQLLSAAGCALLCLMGCWRGWPRPTLLLAVLTLGSCWMMLCGPSTESCTYVLLAPALTWAMLRSEPRPSGSGAAPPPPDGRGSAAVAPRVAYAMLLVSVLAGAFGRTAAQRVHALGLQPLGALAFTVGYSILLLQALAGGAGRVPAGESKGRARAA